MTPERAPWILGPTPPPLGGVATFVSRLCALLAERGRDYHFRGFGGRDDPRPALGEYLRHTRGMRPGDLLVDSATGYLDSGGRQAMLHWLAFRLIRRFRWLRVMHGGTTPERYTGFNPQQKLLYTRMLRSVDAFLVISPLLADWLRDDRNLRQPIHIVPSLLPPVETDLTTPLDPALAAQIAGGDGRILSVGNFMEVYGFEQIAQAVELLRASTGRDLRLILVDGIIGREEAYRERVLRDRPWITPLEWLPPAQTFALMRASDVLIRATRSESYGLSKVEALWCSLPVIATRAGETRGMTLFDFGDVPTLAALIQQTLADPPRAQVSEWAAFYRREAEAHFAAILSVMDSA
jgi:glycosyltransferase involved in cell wall biosynthesis